MTEVERTVVRAARGRLLFVGAFLVLGLASIGLFLRGESTRKIVQHAPCIEHPAGQACQKSKRQSDRKRSIADSCIAFWKVGYDCPAPNSGESIPARGGDAIQPAPAGQHPAPAPAGGKDSPSKGGTESPVSDQPTGEPEPQPVVAAPGGESESTEPPQAASPEAETPGLLDPALSTVCSIADRLAHLC